MKALIFLLIVSTGVTAQKTGIPEDVFAEKYDSILINAVPMKDGKIYYDTIISAQGIKDELFSKVKKWELSTFKIADNPFATENKDDGFFEILTGVKMGFTEYYVSRKDSAIMLLDVNFHIRIYVKDSKIRFIITDFTAQSPNVDDKSLESMPLYEHQHYNNIKKYQSVDFKSRQLNSFSIFFKKLDLGMRVIIKNFIRDITSTQENNF